MRIERKIGFTVRQLFFILLFPIYSSAQIGSGVNDTASSRIKNDYMRILNFGGENDRYIANKEKKVKVYLKGNRSLKTIAQIYCKYSRSDTLPIFVELSSFGLGECVEYAALAPDVANSRKTKVSGNVLYELSYLSHRDTPFLEKNIFHHRIQTHLDILVKNEYPLRISFNTQFSNSGFFRPLSDINIGYNPIDIRRLVKEQFTSRLAKTFDFEDLNRLKSAIDSLQQVLSNMDKQLSDPSEIQRLIEEREKSVAMEFEGLPAGKLDRNRLEYNDVGEMRVQSYVDSISILQKSSKVKSLEADYATLLEQREVVAKEVNKLMQLYKEKENIVRNQAQAIERDINKSNDLRALRTRLGEFGVGDSSVPKIYNLLWNIRSFNLGRSLVNYSELSAKNVSITGI